MIQIVLKCSNPHILRILLIISIIYPALKPCTLITKLLRVYNVDYILYSYSVKELAWGSIASKVHIHSYH